MFGVFVCIRNLTSSFLKVCRTHPLQPTFAYTCSWPSNVQQGVLQLQTSSNSNSYLYTYITCSNYWFFCWRSSFSSSVPVTKLQHFGVVVAVSNCFCSISNDFRLLVRCIFDCTYIRNQLMVADGKWICRPKELNATSTSKRCHRRVSTMPALARE